MGRFMSPDWSAKIVPVPYAKLGVLGAGFGVQVVSPAMRRDVNQATYGPNQDRVRNADHLGGTQSCADSIVG
jgi:hypothetical protein